MSISVIIPCFNAGPFLLEAVDSLLAQQGDHHLNDIIVINDHSTDPDTLAALQRLTQGYSPLVTVLHNSGSPGSGAARNVGLYQAQGDWIAFLDADDRCTVDSLALRYAVTADYPDCDWIGADFALWHDGDAPQDRSYFANKPLSAALLKAAFSSGHAQRFADPLAAFFITSLANIDSVLVRKRALLALGGFDNRFQLQQDLHLFLRLATRSSFVFVPRICCYVRQHSNNATRSECRTLEWRIRVFDALQADPAFSHYQQLLRHKCAAHCLGLCYAYRQQHAFSKALQKAWAAIGYEPQRGAHWLGLAAALGHIA
jgi:glycosyltransferase involved in cell wall biosynthesis